MRCTALVALLAIGLVSPAGGQEPVVPRPSPSQEMTARCRDDDQRLFPVTRLQQRDGWYGKQLRAAREGPLCAAARGTAETYRFTWIPSFSPTVVVRVMFTDSGAILLARRLSGHGGYEPGRLAVERTVRLPVEEARRIRALVDSSGLWRDPPPADTRLGLDGAQWLLEGVRGGEYHAMDWWSPEPEGSGSAVRRLGVHLMSLGRVLPREDGIY